MTYEIEYDRTDEELEKFLFFVVCVAGKNADTTIRAVNSFFDGVDKPFAHLKKLVAEGRLKDELKKHRLGKYGLMDKAVHDILEANLDLRKCSVDDLENIRGIGPKSSRFFLSFTREGTRFAILDVHILRWLSNQGVNCPRNTPTGRKYFELEQEYLDRADALGRTPVEMDYEIWKASREAK